MKIFFILVFMLFVFLSCNAHVYDTEIIINNTKFTVKLAFDNETRARGYMNTKNIPYNNGILFVFKREENLSFWMKDTPTPLGIAYISSEGIIKEIYELKPFSEEIVTSRYKVKYALELPQSSFSVFDVKVGDKVHFKFDIESLEVK